MPGMLIHSALLLQQRLFCCGASNQLLACCPCRNNSLSEGTYGMPAVLQHKRTQVGPLGLHGRLLNRSRGCCTGGRAVEGSCRGGGRRETQVCFQHCWRCLLNSNCLSGTISVQFARVATVVPSRCQHSTSLPSHAFLYRCRAPRCGAGPSQ